jgi:hypothetical protein
MEQLKIFQSISTEPMNAAGVKALHDKMLLECKKDCFLHAIADSGNQIAEATTTFINNL